MQVCRSLTEISKARCGDCGRDFGKLKGRVGDRGGLVQYRGSNCGQPGKWLERRWVWLDTVKERGRRWDGVARLGCVRLVSWAGQDWNWAVNFTTKLTSSRHDMRYMYIWSE